MRSFLPSSASLVADAQSVVALRDAAIGVDPVLVNSLTDKALLASKSTWGPVLTLLVTWLVTRNGIGLDANTCAEISGVLVLLVSGLLRSVTAGPISGLFTTAAVPTVVANTTKTVAMVLMCFGACLSMTACAALALAPMVITDIGSAISAAQAGVQLSQFAIGVAQQAEKVAPELAPKIEVAAVAQTKLQTALADTTTDATTLIALTASATAQANALTLAGAGNISVIPNAPAK